MARPRKPTPIKEYNERGVKYPLNDTFMSMLASVVRDHMTDEIAAAEMYMHYTPDQMAEIFINPHDMEFCKRAVQFFSSSVQWTNSFQSEIMVPDFGVGNLITFRARYQGQRPPVPMPSYVSNGPQDNAAGEVFRLRLREVTKFQRFVADNWLKLYAYVSTLNHRCVSLGDVLANFPGLVTVCRPRAPATNVLRSAKPARNVTKFPEFREVYKDVMRTAHRPILTHKVYRDSTGLWEITSDIDTHWPEWFRTSPGYRAP